MSTVSFLLQRQPDMIILGVVLLILGLLFGIPILWTIGIILIIVGVVLYALGAARTGGRRWY
jgi:hypothetical protein